MAEVSVEASHGGITIERWPTELALLIVVALVSLGLWVFLAISIIGIVYVILIGLFLWTAHLAAIAHVRGSGVRLQPDQFPELYERVREIGVRAGLKREPEAYIMQAGGSLNAFATKFLRADILVLFTELLEACEGDAAARDMVIAHEIGHIRCGHLRWRWLLFPGLLIPFLGTAYARACEYTCDRYGAALCGDARGALRGLAILAAGGRHGRHVNHEALASQRRALDGGFMTIGVWLATHPPLSSRIAALEPALGASSQPRAIGAVKAIAILAVAFSLPVTAFALFVFKLAPELAKGVQQAQAIQQAQAVPQAAPAPRKALSAQEIEKARDQVQKDFAALADAAESFRKRHGRLPTDVNGLYNAWSSVRSAESMPRDPFDENWYGYSVSRERFWLWSAGPDAEGDTDDDIEYQSPER